MLLWCWTGGLVERYKLETSEWESRSETVGVWRYKRVAWEVGDDGGNMEAGEEIRKGNNLDRLPWSGDNWFMDKGKRYRKLDDVRHHRHVNFTKLMGIW